MNPRSIQLFNALFVLGIFFSVQYIGFHWLLHPELTYDEGYYIMGARRLLEGDWFLQNHSFDKPFLHPLLLALSATLFGNSFLGFRFLGWILFSISLFIFSSLLTKLFTQNSPSQSTFRSVVFLIFKTIILGFLFLHPVMIKNCATSMGEPFFMFFVCLTLASLAPKLKRSDRKLDSKDHLSFEAKKKYHFINAWFLTFWIKGSILTLIPYFLFFDWPRPFQWSSYWEKRNFLWPFIIVNLLGLWYGLIGKTKFFVFRFLFDVLFAKKNQSYPYSNFFEKFHGLFRLILENYQFPFFFLLLFIFITSGMIFFKKNKVNDHTNRIFSEWRRHFYPESFLLVLSVFSLVLFFIIILFTKVGIIDRYLLTITPVMSFAIALIVKILIDRHLLSHHFWVKCFFLTAIAFSLIFVSLKGKEWFPPLLPSSHMAILSPAIESEIPSDSTLINQIVWPHGAYVPKDIVIVEKPQDLRLNRHLGNFNWSTAAFAFDNNQLYEAIQYKNPVNGKLCPKIEKLHQPLIAFNTEELKTFFLRAFLAEGHLEWSEFHLAIKTLSPPSDFLKQFPFSFKEASSGITLKGQLLGKKKVYGDFPQLEVEGEFVFYRGRSLESFWKSKNTWALGFRLRHLKWTNQNWNLMPIVLIAKKGFTFPILPIALENSNQRPFFLDIEENKIEPANKHVFIYGIVYQPQC